MATFSYALAILTGIPVIVLVLCIALTVCVVLTTSDTARRHHARSTLRDLLTALNRPGESGDLLV